MATKKFDLTTALIQAGFERGTDKETIDPAYGSYQTLVLRKSYSTDQRVNDFGILNRGFNVEVQVLYHNGKCYGVTVLYGNGKVKSHAYDKRAYNAIRDTVKYNGFEL